MALSFVPKGPVYIEDGTEIQFKRVKQVEINKFNYENNPFQNRPREEYSEILKKINEGKIHEVDYTPEETMISLSQMPKFCVEFVEEVRNLQVDGKPIDWKELADDHKYIFFDELYHESDDFRDFVLNVKSGAKKKFTEVDSD